MTFASVPQTTPAGDVTTTDLVLLVTGVTDPTSVTFVLSGGFVFANATATATYTSSNGKIVIPAGAIRAGYTTGSITATAVLNGETASATASLTVAAAYAPGHIRYGTDTVYPEQYFVGGTNSGFVSLTASSINGHYLIAGLRENGEIWKKTGTGTTNWNLISSGGTATGINTVATHDGMNVYNISTSGQIRYNLDYIYDDQYFVGGTNSGFVSITNSTTTTECMLMALRENGEIWKKTGIGTNSWTRVSQGGTAMGINTVASADGLNVYNISTSGQIRYGSDDIYPDQYFVGGTNSGFVSLTGSSADTKYVLMALRENGEVWKKTGSTTSSSSNNWTRVSQGGTAMGINTVASADGLNVYSINTTAL